MDLVRISRIEKIIRRHGKRFIEKVFTPDEAGYCYSKKNPYPSFSARFAAKEAGIKLLGAGMYKTGFRDVEVIMAGSGKPSLAFLGRAADMAERLGIYHVSVSLSHDGGMAVAVAVAMVRK